MLLMSVFDNICSAASFLSPFLQSRLLHDGGNKHKFNVDEFNKKKRDDKLHGAQNERDVRKQLAEINQAAKEALATDRVENASFFHNSSSNRSGSSSYSGVGGCWDGAPPPPPPPHLQAASSSSFHLETHSSIRTGRMAAVNDDEPMFPEENSGIYEIMGKRYFQGQRCEHVLHSGFFCEVFVENEDDWLPAVIVGVREVPVPYTTVTLKMFSVSYSSSGGVDGSGPGLVTEEGVRSDRLRAWVDEADNIVDADGQVLVTAVHCRPAAPTGGEERLRDTGAGEGEGEIPVAVAASVVESTGLGAWETVAVRVVDEEQEAFERADRERAEAAEEQQSLRAPVSSRTSGESGDDVLSSYDPYGTNVYKGVQLDVGVRGYIAHVAERREAELETMTQKGGTVVGFKRRKKSGDGNASGVESQADKVKVEKVEEGSVGAGVGAGVIFCDSSNSVGEEIQTDRNRLPSPATVAHHQSSSVIPPPPPPALAPSEVLHKPAAIAGKISFSLGGGAGAKKIRKVGE